MRRLTIVIASIAVGLPLLLALALGFAMYSAVGKASSALTQFLVSWVMFTIVSGAYFYPSIKAATKYHHSARSVFLLNALLGWTIVGWIAAMVWAHITPQAVRVVTPAGSDDSGFCSRCGAPRGDGAYCPRCGSPLTS